MTKEGAKVFGSVRAGLLAIFVIVVVATAIGLTWAWFVQTPPAKVLDAEDSLADGQLIAIGYANTSRLRFLKRHWLGESDPASLPLEKSDNDLLTALFSGDSKNRVDHLLIGLNAAREGRSGARTAILLGTFEPAAVNGLFQATYDVQALGQNQWRLTRKVNESGQFACADAGPSSAAQQPFYLFASVDYLLFGTDQAHVSKIWRRLNERAEAQQSLSAWRSYRERQLASLLVMTPPQLAKAYGGMPGMVVNQAVQNSPPMNLLAARIGVDPMLIGLGLNLNLGVADQSWVDKTATEWRNALEQAKHDTRSYTPTLARFLSRIRVQGNPQSLDLVLALDGEAIDELSHVVEEGMSSLFSGWGAVGGDQPVTEQIQQSSLDYSKTVQFKHLPPLQVDENRVAPLFHKGAFAIDLKSISQNDEGLLELVLEGEVAIPETDALQVSKLVELAFHIASVADQNGNELMRDERCVEGGSFSGRNHEPADTVMPGNGRISIRKRVRLKPGTEVNDIRKISGQLRFTAPTQVNRHSLALGAGEVFEGAGLRFYLNRLGDHSVTYQVSGNTAALKELRALNKAGQPLQEGWRMSTSGEARTTQRFNGEVAALELFVAESVNAQTVDFVLGDLFSVPEEPETRPAFAPESVDVRIWKDYQALDMQQLTIDPKDWHLWGKPVYRLGAQIGNGVSVHFTHKPQAWGNNPGAHIYFPMLSELPGVLSALSYRIDEPAADKSAPEQYIKISYPYYSESGETVIKHRLNDKAVALMNLTLKTGLKDNDKLERLKGEFTFRLPIKTQRSRLAFADLWKGKTVDGVTVTLTDVGRGTFPGYGLKLEGELEKLVNLNGLTPTGKKVMPSPVNYQDGGYWTMTLPFANLDALELTTAGEQEIYKYPFDIEPDYSTLLDSRRR